VANRQCNPTKRVNTAQGLRFCAVVLSANGRVKPDVVLIGNKEERHAEGAYYLDWREGLPWHLVATAASVNFFHYSECPPHSIIDCGQHSGTSSRTELAFWPQGLRP